MTKTDKELINYFTRVRETDDGLFVFEVAGVNWPHPHEPELYWMPFRTWKRQPSPERVSAAAQKAVNTSRFFSTCRNCGEKCNRGHMMEKDLCYGCASELYGIIY